MRQCQGRCRCLALRTERFRNGVLAAAGAPFSLLGLICIAAGAFDLSLQSVSVFYTTSSGTLRGYVPNFSAFRNAAGRV